MKGDGEGELEPGEYEDIHDAERRGFAVQALKPTKAGETSMTRKTKTANVELRSEERESGTIQETESQKIVDEGIRSAPDFLPAHIISRIIIRCRLLCSRLELVSRAVTAGFVDRCPLQVQIAEMRLSVFDKLGRDNPPSATINPPGLSPCSWILLLDAALPRFEMSGLSSRTRSLSLRIIEANTDNPVMFPCGADCRWASAHPTDLWSEWIFCSHPRKGGAVHPGRDCPYYAARTGDSEKTETAPQDSQS
jgi:hypothetical protein